MQNASLCKDYIVRAEHRLAALEVLWQRESWADVVRESQEIVELSLKALLRFGHIEVPRIHDVSQIMNDNKTQLPPSLLPHLPRLSTNSKSLRRDREQAFYGSEDLTPSEFYSKPDAEQARADATWVVATLKPNIAP